MWLLLVIDLACSGAWQITFGVLSSEKDYEETSAFFKERDPAHFDLALRQSLDGIRTRAAWIKVRH